MINHWGSLSHLGFNECLMITINNDILGFWGKCGSKTIDLNLAIGFGSKDGTEAIELKLGCVVTWMRPYMKTFQNI